MNKDAHYPGPGPRFPANKLGSRHFLLGVILLLSACASTPPPRPPAQHALITDATPNDPIRANNVLMRALGLVGTPYHWGGNTPESGFDCSGLVNFVFRDAARLTLPRSTDELANYRAAAPAKNRLAAGDLVLFGQGQVNHVGIYVGQGRFVHAPNEGGTVRLDFIDGPYWRDAYRGAKRVLP